ncbi:hypothetical protein PCK1_001444 [Pneumocystis canis]|nr:hypothetical protein PCK1_001444 [Pneumocystis canis]
MFYFWVGRDFVSEDSVMMRNLNFVKRILPKLTQFPFSRQNVIRYYIKYPLDKSGLRFFHNNFIQSSISYIHKNSPNNNPDIPFEFTPENMERAKIIISRYPSEWKKAAVMPLLDLGQRQLGYTSISVMNYVAKLLDIPKMRVYEVATFYTMYNREPVGTLVQVCTTTPCQLCGSDEILKVVQDYLGITPGHTTSDGKFTLMEIECAGACVNAPLITIGDNYYEDLNPETCVDILKMIKVGKMPKHGPQNGRQSCEPKSGLTSLIDEPWTSSSVLRKDADCVLFTEFRNSTLGISLNRAVPSIMSSSKAIVQKSLENQDFMLKPGVLSVTVVEAVNLSLPPGVSLPELSSSVERHSYAMEGKNQAQSRSLSFPYLVLEFDRNQVLVDALAGSSTICHPRWEYKVNL